MPAREATAVTEHRPSGINEWRAMLRHRRLFHEAFPLPLPLRGEDTEEVLQFLLHRLFGFVI